MALVAAPTGPAKAVDFLRGDSNSDGEVTISDAYFTLAFLFGSGQLPECGDAADATADGVLNIADPVKTLNFVISDLAAPAEPFPDIGPAPGPGLQHPPCETYGGGSALDDPAAALKIGPALADGGATRNASITLTVSSSVPIGGVYAEIIDEARVIAPGRARLGPLTEHDGSLLYVSARNVDGIVKLAYLPSLEGMGPPIPPGEDVAALQIELCLRPGTAAGEYPLTIRAGELVAGCDSTGCGDDAGRAIRPALHGGVLVITDAVADHARCEDRRPPSPPRVDPPPPPLPPPPPGVDFDGEVRIGSARARPGDDVQLPFIVRSNVGVQGFAFSIDFDEEVLEATAVEERFIDPTTAALPFWVSGINNSNETPGNGGVDEGYVVGAGVLDLRGQFALPTDTDNVPVLLHFTVNPETTASETELRFLDGGSVRPGEPGVQNLLTAVGRSLDPEDAISTITIDGILNILPDVSAFFLRGDANGDRDVDLADAQFTLNYMFQGGPSPPCRDAADANDDGRINLTDPVAILQVLFAGRSALPHPAAAPGVDPTPDELGCAVGLEG